MSGGGVRADTTLARDFWPGLCECGCGEMTKIAAKTDRGRGHTQGESLRFINHHNRRGATVPEDERYKHGSPGDRNPMWAGENVGYRSLHYWVALRKTKTGCCSECGENVGVARGRGTQWANVSGEYRRELGDYVELCPRCHRVFDNARKEKV